MNHLPERLALFRVSRVALFALAFVFGCEETDTKGWLVDRTRVLGVRFEAKADAARAAISPGEPMRATWLVGAPNGTGRLTWAYAICPPVFGNFPEPRCEGPVLVSAAGASDGELVTMELEAPRAEAVADLEGLQMLVAFCEAGDAVLDAARFEGTCAGSSSPPRLASAAIRLAAAGPNANPSIAADAILLDGQPLVPSSLRPGAACNGEPESPVVAPGSKHKLAIRFRGDEREPIPGSKEGVESILASHVVTTGELERQYSMLDPTDPLPKEAPVEWTAPAREQVPEGGRLAEVYVVVRDGRGGAAFARRTVCVRP